MIRRINVGVLCKILVTILKHFSRKDKQDFGSKCSKSTCLYNCNVQYLGAKGLGYVEPGSSRSHFKINYKDH